MRKATNFYSIGLFTLLGLTLFIILLLAMGGRSWFSRPVYIESYFNESVQGLTVGSAVKYRGVTVGRVSTLNFVDDIYDTKPVDNNPQFFNHYVYVLMAINLNLFSAYDRDHIQDFFDKAVKEGLRVHLSPDGLTGSSYLELDFYDSKNSPPLPISWVPFHPYVPSKLSTLSQITTNLNKFIEDLGNANVAETMKNINNMAMDTDQAMNRVNNILADQQPNIEASIANLRAITDNLRTISENAKNYPSSFIFGAKPPKLDLNNDQQQNN